MERAKPTSMFEMATTMFSTVASMIATLMLVQSVFRDIIPFNVSNFIVSSFRKAFARFSSQVTMVVEESDGWVPNHMFQSIDVYLGSRLSSSVRRIKITQAEPDTEFNVRVDANEEITDIFQGVLFKWRLEVKIHQPSDQSRGADRTESKSFHVLFPAKNRDMALKVYLPYIAEQAKLLTRKKNGIKLHTLDPENMYGNLTDAWTSASLNHPATFDTLAMDYKMKDMLLKDLEMFLKRREYYRKVGKAWKRGYLLYGPPGTGKSSLIAAIANKLNFDIYELELTEIKSNTDLKKLLVATKSRSILVVEDIDCTVELHDRQSPLGKHVSNDNSGKSEPQVTLSGFLNFIDGLWTSRGDERIIIFTTNHRDKLDPALLRPGRMDVHVHMSYCTADGFRTLASNYLGIGEHKSFKKIDDLLPEAKVTPAEVAEQLMRSDGSEKGLKEMIEFMETRIKESQASSTRLEPEAPSAPQGPEAPSTNQEPGDDSPRTGGAVE